MALTLIMVRIREIAITMTDVIVAGGVLATEAVGSNRVPDLATGREPHRAQVHNT